MISPIKINGKQIVIPDSWDEITFGMFRRLKDATTDADVLSALTGLDIEICNLVPAEVAAAVLAPISYLAKELPEVDVTGFVPANIGKKEFARKINCDNAFKKLKDYDVIRRVVAVYCCPGIEDEDIAAFEPEIDKESGAKIVSAYNNIFAQLEKLRLSEAKIKSVTYKPEELTAGVNDFKIYGTFGLVRSIALRWGISKDEVYRWSYNDVLLELKYSAQESVYQRRLNEILSKPKK